MKKLKSLSYSFLKGLLICVILTFVTTTFFSWRIQNFLCHNETEKLISVNINDVQQDINDASDANMLALAREITAVLDEADEINADRLRSLYTKYNVAEIDIIGPDGIITHSTNSKFVGFDMSSGKQ